MFFAGLALGRMAVVAALEAEREVAATEAAEAAHPRRKETSMPRGFQNFLMQGDLIIIAVGRVVALAFSTLITSFTDNIIAPLVNALAGGPLRRRRVGSWTYRGPLDAGARRSRRS